MTTHPARNPKTERWLDQLGATWTFDPDLPIARIDQAASLANQVRHQPITEEVVERYAVDMAQGDTFPPIIVTPSHDDLHAILGGIHRDAAHRRARHTTQPAYIVTGDRTVLLRISVEDNRNHGLPTTKAERLDHGVMLIATGYSGRDAAKIVGLPQPDLTIHAATLDLARRIDGHPNAAAINKLARSTRYELSRIDDDDVLAALADLTAAAGLPAAQVRDLVAAANATDTVEALRLIGSEREDRHDAIRDRAGNVRASSRTARAKLDTALAEIATLDPGDIYATCPNDDVRAVLAQRIMNAARVLQASYELLAATKMQGRAA